MFKTSFALFVSSRITEEIFFVEGIAHLHRIDFEYIMNEHETGCCLAKNSMPQENTVWWRS